VAASHLPLHDVTGAGLACTARLVRGTLALDVTIDVEPGELVVVVGPNGAGKTTLMGVIAGLLAIDEGRVVLDGEVLDDPAARRFVESRKRAIGMVFQDLLLFDNMSVVDNVAFGLRSRGTSRREARRAAMEWLERFGLGAMADARPTALSGGQAQRVALGRALAFGPKLLLLDEPFAALDATTRSEVRREVRAHLATLAVPKLLVSHDAVEAITLADRIVVLEDGRIVQQGRPDEIRLHPRSRYVADLVGINLFRGDLRDGTLTLASGHQIAVAADGSDNGAVVATLHPHAVTLHHTAPEGSARNAWSTTVADIDDEGDRVRVRVGDPLPLAIEITKPALTELALHPGVAVWISFKATEVALQQD
jgi:molybdate transport system ATP-binding protein